MYRNILVPIDGSETANLGLEEAIRLAQSQGGRIRLVHIVNEFLPLAPTLYSANIVSVMETIRKAGESALEAAEAAVRRAGVEVDTRLVEAPGGQAGANVVEQAIEWPAEAHRVWHARASRYPARGARKRCGVHRASDPSAGAAGSQS